jgi:hypothetical protein
MLILCLLKSSFIIKKTERKKSREIERGKEDRKKREKRGKRKEVKEEKEGI